MNQLIPWSEPDCVWKAEEREILCALLNCPVQDGKHCHAGNAQWALKDRSQLLPFVHIHT